MQERLAAKELAQIDKQIVAAEIRQDRRTRLKNHDLQIENTKKADEFMRAKFTNRELYDWMVGQISAVYFQLISWLTTSQRRRSVLTASSWGIDDHVYPFGYWDSLKKGLQSADALIYDIKRMETATSKRNKREYEITKQVSLALLDPLALVRLRATGDSISRYPRPVRHGPSRTLLPPHQVR